MKTLIRKKRMGSSTITTKRVRTTLDLSQEEHKKLKAIAAWKEVSLRDLILECIRDKYEKTPNKETAEAMRQGETGEELLRFDNIEDMFKNLGI